LSTRFLGVLSEALRTQSRGLIEGCLLLGSILSHSLVALPSLNFLLEKGFGATLGIGGTRSCHGCVENL